MASTTDSLILEIKVDAATGLPVLKGVRKETEETAKAMGNTATQADHAAKKMSGVWKSLAVGVAALAAVGVAWGGLSRIVSGSIAEFRQSEAIHAQLEAVIKSTGGAAGMTAQEITKMSGSMSMLAAVDDDLIKASSAMLMKFTSIGRDVFPRAQQAILDVSRAMGKDLQSTTVMIGKALNAPAESLTALTRAGIQFTASQKAMIKNFVEMGQVSKAQGIVLQEIERQMGGSAAAYAKTFAGMMDKMSIAAGNIKEKFGGAIVKALIPHMERLLAWVEKNQAAIEAFAVKAGDAIGRFVVGLKDSLVWIIKHKDEILAVGAIITAAFAVSKIAAFASALSTLPGKITVIGMALASLIKFSPMAAARGYVQEIADARTAMLSMAQGQMQSVMDAMSAAQKKYIADTENQKKAAHQTDLDRIKARGERYLEALERDMAARKAAYDQEVDQINKLLDQFYGVKETLADQLVAHQANARALGITGDMAERLAAAIKDAQFRQVLEAMPKAAEKTSQKLYDMIPPIQRTYDFTERLKNPLDDVAEGSERITSEWEKMSDALGGASEILNGMTDLFEGVGLSGLANITNQLSGISQGAAGAFGSFASGDIIGGISQSLSTLGSVASFMSDIFGWNKSGVDDWVKQFDRLGVSISENIVEQIKEATKAGERASTVQAQLTDQIISDGEVTARNLDGYKRLVQDIFMEIDNGRITGASAVKEVGDAFAALAKKAEEAGLSGSKALADLLNDARNRGLVGEDILSYVDPARQKGLDALATHIAGTSGSLAGFGAAMRQTDAFFASMVADGKDIFSILDALGPALDKLKTIGKEKGYSTGYLVNLFGMQEFLTKNQDVIASIQATQTVMESMANTGILTQDRFTEFAASTWDYYKKLTKGGKNEEQAIQALLPMLGKQLWYAEQYGFELDENTKKLIEEAKAQGLKLDAAIPAEERMAQGIEKLVALFEKLTGGVDSTTGAITRMSDAASKFKLQPYDGADYEKYFNAGGGKSIPGYATGTGGWQYPDDAWISGENGPELNLWDRRRGKINIAPLGKSGSDSYTGAVGSTQNISLGGVTLHVTNQISGGTDVLKQVENALALNINRLADKTAKAVKERLNVKR